MGDIVAAGGEDENENLEVIQAWFNFESGMEAGVSQLRHAGLVSIVRRGDEMEIS
jgi:hypothetical protein